VLCFHARGLISGPTYLDLGERLFLNGAAGVDLFFVISGFIMVHTTWTSDGSAAYTLRFFCRRLARIWPVYAVVTLVYLAVRNGPSRIVTSTDSLLKLAKALVFLPRSDYGAPFFGYAPLDVGWTLNYEVWFYLLFGAAMLAGRWRWQATGALFALFMLALPRLLTGHVTGDAYESYGLHPGLLNLAGNPMIWEFLAGVAIGLVLRSRFRIRSRELLGSFVAISVGAVLWQFFSGYERGHGPLHWGLPLALMVLALALYNQQRAIRVPGWLKWLGDVSFSLYLVQRIPQVAFPRQVTDPEYASRLTGGGYFVASTMASLILAHWSYRLLERGLAERVRIWLLGQLPENK
jgi:hypothetical protein